MRTFSSRNPFLSQNYLEVGTLPSSIGARTEIRRLYSFCLTTMISVKSLFVLLASFALVRAYECGTYRPLVESAKTGCLGESTCFEKARETSLNLFELDFSDTINYFVDLLFGNRRLRGEGGESQDQRRMAKTCDACSSSTSKYLCLFQKCRSRRELRLFSFFLGFNSQPPPPTAQTYVIPGLDFYANACWQVVDVNQDPDAKAFVDGVKAEMDNEVNVIVQKWVCDC